MSPPAQRPARPAADVRRLLAALTTVVLAVLVGAVSSSAPADPTYQHYVALGDSFTAAPYVPVTDIARGCYRSNNNYPQLVAATLHVADVVDRSCSGADTHDLSKGQRKLRGVAIAPQLDALSPRTDLVTVGIGANNGRLYARIATACRLEPGICRLHDQRDELDAVLDRLRPALGASLEEIEERAPEARVLLVGYPQLLPPRGDCARLPRMRPQDRDTFRDVNERLNREMAAAAEDVGVDFVDFEAESLGHDVCSPAPWVQGRVGSNRRGAALHPLAAGQVALADLIAATLRADD